MLDDGLEMKSAEHLVDIWSNFVIDQYPVVSGFKEEDSATFTTKLNK